MGIFKKKQIITIEVAGKNKYMIKTNGIVNIAETCDALLGAFCIAAKILVKNTTITPETIRQLVAKEIDKVFTEMEE